MPNYIKKVYTFTPWERGTLVSTEDWFQDSWGYQNLQMLESFI